MGSGGYNLRQLQQKQIQIDLMKGTEANENHHLQALTKNYHSVISEIHVFQRNLVAQDQLQNLISRLMNPGAGNNNNPSDEQALMLFPPRVFPLS